MELPHPGCKPPSHRAPEASGRRRASMAHLPAQRKTPSLPSRAHSLSAQGQDWLSAGLFLHGGADGPGLLILRLGAKWQPSLTQVLSCCPNSRAPGMGDTRMGIVEHWGRRWGWGTKRTCGLHVAGREGSVSTIPGLLLVTGRAGSPPVTPGGSTKGNNRLLSRSPATFPAAPGVGFFLLPSH